MPSTAIKKFIKQPFRLTSSGNIHFTQREESLQQQLNGNFITLRPNQGLLEVSGPDASSFLQGQLSCDLNALDDTTTSLGVHCTAQGRVIASFRIWRAAADCYAIALPLTTLPLLHNSLARYIVFSKASIVDRSTDQFAICVSGHQVAEVIEQEFGQSPQAVNDQVINELGSCTRVPGEAPRFELFLPPERAAQFWEQACGTCQPANSNTWALQNIRAGLATIGTHTTEMFIPQMLNYDRVGAISFDKGCYTGQEIIARAHYRGAVKRRLHHFTSQTTIKPSINQQVFVGKKQVGTIVAVAIPEPGALEGLVVLQEGIQETVQLSPSNPPRLHTTPCHPTT